MLDVLPLLGVWFVAVVTPGPDFVVVVGHATSRSRRHGAMVAVGVSSAMVLWATGSLLGLSMLLARLSWLYEVIRLVGAAYLVYLGVKMLWSSRKREPEQTWAPVAETGGLWRSWRVGFLTNAANPKAAVFFGSLFGALMPRDAGVGLGLFVVAAVVAIALVWYLLVVRLFGSAPVLRVYRRIRRWIDRVAATVLIAFGGRLALDR